MQAQMQKYALSISHNIGRLDESVGCKVWGVV